METYKQFTHSPRPPKREDDTPVQGPDCPEYFLPSFIAMDPRIGPQAMSGPRHFSSVEMERHPKGEVELRVYKRRFWMVCLFSFMSLLCGLLFSIYTSMASVTTCYYGVTDEAVVWTGMLYMILYAVLVFPASSLMNCMGLRWTVIFSSFFSTAACAVQFAAVSPSSFTMVMVVAFLGSMANLFVLGVPPVLAAKWFPSDEVSRACAMGVFGNQLGVALGFIVPPAMIPGDCKDKTLIGVGRMNLAYVLTAVNLVVFILIVFTFQNEPKAPPSLAQAYKSNEKAESHTKVVLGMLKNVNFVLIFVVYGLIVGIYFYLATVLNILIEPFFKGKVKEIGYMGLLMIVAGLVGSIIAGYVLDATHKFKETTIAICIASLLTSIVFSIFLFVGQIWVQYITISIFGFFLTSFLPIGFEYGIEVTYPQSETVCACLLNTSTMIFGLAITEGLSQLLDKEGAMSACTAMSVVIFLACIISGFITKDYKRTNSNSKLKSNGTP